MVTGHVLRRRLICALVTFGRLKLKADLGAFRHHEGFLRSAGTESLLLATQVVDQLVLQSDLRRFQIDARDGGFGGKCFASDSAGLIESSGFLSLALDERGTVFGRLLAPLGLN